MALKPLSPYNLVYKLFLNYDSLPARYKNTLSSLFKHNPKLLDELLEKKIVITNKLNSGSSRFVFNCFYIKDLNKYNELPLYVIKFTHNDLSYNLEEINLWKKANKDKSLKDLLPWLCPIKDYNTKGHYLIMKKAKPITSTQFSNLDLDLHPYLDDIWYFNFGLIGDKAVCIDYADHNAD